jgi:AraC-like DNA-binding protein
MPASQILSELPIVTTIKIRDQPPVTGTFIDPEYVFVYYEVGSCEYQIEDRLYSIKPGMVSIKPPFILHAIRPVDLPYRRLVVHFTLTRSSAFFRGLPLIVELSEEARSLCMAKFHEMQIIHRTKSLGYETVIGGLMAELLGIYLAYTGEDTDYRPQAIKVWRHLDRGMQFMKKNLEKQLSLENTSEHVGLNPAYFCKIFKKHTGLSPHLYLNICRIERAKHLLLNGKLSFEEAAGQTGFASEHAFGKVFKRLTGLTPSAWMKQPR